MMLKLAPERIGVIPRCDESMALRDWLRKLGIRYMSGRFEVPLDLERIDELATGAERFGASVTMAPDMEHWVAMERYRQQRLASIRSGIFVPEPGVGWERRPLDHQVGGMSWLYTSDWCILNDDPGLGKTYTAINAACSLLANKVVHVPRVVVLCPNGVKDTWEEEIASWAWPTPSEHRIAIPSGPTKRRARQILAAIDDNAHVNWIVLNYEALRYFPDEFHAACDGAILVADEGHRLKGAFAKVRGIVAQARPAKLWLMTGTVIGNKADDLWGLLDLVRPGLVGFSWYSFERAHIVRDKRNIIRGYRKVELLQKQLAKVSLSRKLADCIDLPPLIIQKRSVDLATDERSAYDSMKKHMRAVIDEYADPPTPVQVRDFGSKVNKLRQITDGYLQQRVGEEVQWAKSPSKLSEMVQAYDDAGRPRCVVWFQWRESLKRAVDMLRSAGANAWPIYGDVKLADRKEHVAKWRSDPSGVLVCQMNAAGEGLNLQVASHMIFVDLPTTPRQMQQCMGRMHRQGQRSSVVAEYILARNTVDQYIFRDAKKRSEWSDLIASVSGGRANMLEAIS